MLLCVMNGNQIMAHQVKSATTTLSSPFDVRTINRLSIYSIVKRKLYGRKYPNPLKSFMNSVSRHTFSKLFQLCRGHGVLGKYFRTKCIDERDHNCECGHLETVGHVLKECPLHPAERNFLKKVSPVLDPKILLDTREGLSAVVKFLLEMYQCHLIQSKVYLN